MPTRFDRWQPADLVTQIHRLDWSEFGERCGDTYFLLVPTEETRGARITGSSSALGFRPDADDEEERMDTYPGLGTHLTEVATQAESLGDRLGNRPHFVLPVCISPCGEGEAQVLVGRSSRSDMCLKHANVSKQHAVFTYTGGAGLVLRDLNSRNGTRVNGQQVLGETVVRSGDRIRFGYLNTTLCNPEVLWTLMNCDVPTQADVVPLHV